MSSRLDCKISCETLKCENCGKRAANCSIKRNCKPQMAKFSYYRVTNGPGSQLKTLLSRIGIKASDGCKCSDRARHIDFMEENDPGWTERNIEEIVDWMEKEAKKRKLPFIRVAAKTLVKLAIRRAKK